MVCVEKACWDEIIGFDRAKSWLKFPNPVVVQSLKIWTLSPLGRRTCYVWKCPPRDFIYPFCKFCKCYDALLM